MTTSIRTNLPRDLHDSLIAYCTRRRETGGFLRACLENDFVKACSRCDMTNLQHIAKVARWIFTYAPANCWGSPEKVTAWLNGEGGPAFVEPGGE